MYEMIDTVQATFPQLLAQEAPASDFPPAQWMSKLDREEIFVVCLVILGSLTAVVIVAITSISGLIQTMRISHARSKMMQQLLDRGYSPLEIRGLVELIGAPAKSKETQVAPAAPSIPPRVELSDVPPAKPIVAASR